MEGESLQTYIELKYDCGASPDEPAMETVPLEVDDEQDNEKIVTLDTVKFEIEAENAMSSPKTSQLFFDKSTDKFDSRAIPRLFDHVHLSPQDVRPSPLLKSVNEEEDSDSVNDVVSSSFHMNEGGFPASISRLIPECEVNDKPSKHLSKLFTDERHGSDTVGKAFFDTLTDLMVDKNQSIVDNRQFYDSTLCDDNQDDSYCFWIPKIETKQAFRLVTSTPFGVNVLEKKNLTMPGVIMTEELNDPIRDLARQYLEINVEAKRFMLTADNVSQDEEGLTKLINIGCFRAAVNLTTRILTKYGQGLKKCGHPSINSPQSLQIWLIRLSLLLKLRLFNMAEAESEPFSDLDKPDLYFEFYPELYGSRQGTMVPFAFRILLTQILTCVGKFGEALHRLYAILNTVTQIIEDLVKGQEQDGKLNFETQAALKLWRKREIKILYTITNCLVAQNDFYSAYCLLDTILEKMPESTANIKSAQGHILLQLGDIQLAQTSFGLAAVARADTDKQLVAALLDKASICISRNVFDAAYNFLNEALSLDGNNAMVINNMAVCLLYMGKLKDSFSLLEDAITKTPKFFIHECILVNICTLYDLESSRSLQKKSTILEVVCHNAGDGFNVFCLKLQSIT